MTVDISNFHLNNPMPRYDYTMMKLDMFLDDVIKKYNLLGKVEPDGHIYIEVRTGMYGLTQLGLLAQELLTEHLVKHGYKQSKVTPGLWTHKWRPICFSLVVDDFGINVGHEHADHLTLALKETYKIEVDTEGANYIGISLDWDYVKGEVHLSMPGYDAEALRRFKHIWLGKTEDQPYAYVIPNYGAKVQYAPDDNTS